MPTIRDAYNLVIQACNDPNIGYSQGDRYSIKLGVGYVTHCDCSSLMAWALTGAGYFSVNPWFTTHEESMPTILRGAGFQELDPSTTPWMEGDILWRHNSRSQHTEMVYQANGTTGISMGAHTAGSSEHPHPFPDQVSINSFYTTGGDWMRLYRAPDAGGFIALPSWSQGDGTYSGTITAEQTYNNAILINYFFSNLGATRAVCAGILGNFDLETGGHLDPNLWFNGTIGSVAYGLPQFNPASGYRTFAQQNGIDLNNADQNGNFQLRCIAENLMGGWLPKPGYRYTWEEFLQITDPILACKVFYEEFERGGDLQYGDREVRTMKWFEEIPKFPSDTGSVLARYYPWLFGALENLKRRKLLL